MEPTNNGQHKLVIRADHHIFLDLDGVLADFVGGCEKLFDKDLSTMDNWGIWDYLGVTSNEFWTTIELEKYFWAELKPYPWARELVNLCLELTKGNVTICTSPATDPNCSAQKVYWIAQHFPGLNRAFLIGPQKHLLAKPNHILIDDFDDNIAKFEKHGGYGITFPQLWNKAKWKPEDIESVTDHIRTQVNNIFVQKITKEA